MKIFVTGGAGFMGSALRAALAAGNHEVTAPGSKECDLTDANALRRYAAVPYERIFHLAAWTQAGDFCLKHPGEQWLINQRINTHVLGWWRERQPQAKLICMGTSCSYDPALPLTEANYLEGRPIDSLFTYAMTKRMLLVGLMAMHRQFGINYLHLVPSTLFGPGYHTDGRQMHFIFDLIRKIMRGKVHGEPVVLWGDGHQRRELIYVDDFVAQAVQLSSLVTNDTVNIGSGEEHSIREFARLICEQVGYDSNAIQYDAARYTGAKTKCLDVGVLRRLLGDFATTPLQTGLARTVDWFWERRSSLLEAAV